MPRADPEAGLTDRKGSTMKRNVALKILNPILALLILNQFVTAMASDAMSHDAFEVLHEEGGMVLFAVVLLNVILNWNWIRASYFRGKASGA